MIILAQAAVRGSLGRSTGSGLKAQGSSKIVESEVEGFA